MKTKINYFAIITFFTIAISLRYLSNKTTILDNVNSEFIKVILQAVGPAIGAIVAFLIFKIKPKLTLKGNYKNLIIPFILYWIFPIILILTVEYFTKGTFSIIPIFAILIYGLLEEIGWRGFLQHELRSLPKLLNIIIVAILWFIWHLNFEMSSGNILFFGILVLASWGIGKVADSTQSFLAVSAFHSLNNFFPEMNTTKIIILLVLVGTWVILLIDRKKRNQKKEASL
ncbi:CPBP family intramembrane metalloprotease [Flavobacterium sp. I-SCBP12n]|uniref:CPBP family intramembrane metalloprotease n=1 Tax=Flavobacterium pygoscelis TaxID=2893176 RepID=A0A9X1XN87_9FLAO|nr:CPBP family intramembrane glutamic endopeptidase [Flavobacterium pygoscelis]MCK8140730.1 CPBP family intramembrane metalloprotease [Flavobacterium pygoscelis]